MPKASNVPMSTLIRGELFAPIEKNHTNSPDSMIRLAVRMSFLSALIFGAQYANEPRQL